MKSKVEESATGEHPQGRREEGCGCVILLGGIFTLSKMWDVDAKFAKGVSFKSKKRQDADVIVHDRQAEKYLQVRRKASCRYISQEKSICNRKYQGLADTSVATKTSITRNKRDV